VPLFAHSVSSRPEIQLLSVDAAGIGQRLDNYLIRRLKGVPRSRIYRAIRSGEVRVNGGRGRPERRLESGDEVRVPPLRMTAGAVPGPAHAAGRQLLESIILEDDDLLVLDKPAGISVHGGTGNPVGVIEALRCARPDLEGLELAHRLDRDTSGLLLLARNRPALRALHAMMTDRESSMRKTYTALLAGCWDGGARVVDAPIQRVSGRHSGRSGRVADQGRLSSTRFVPVRQVGGCTLAEVELFSGRTHQIRVHAAHIGHPVAGDGAYGDRSGNARVAALGLARPFLHASRLRLRHPGDGRELDLHSPLPPDLVDVLAKLETAVTVGELGG
jgi:23S rRNA pseudouridine955/2504/2580 synthase